MARKEVKTGQRFFCDQQGCTKSYSRMDHLARHKLNHDTRKEDLLHCKLCGKTFVRQDLLTRHLDRHELNGQKLGRWAKTQQPEASSSSSTSKQQKRGRTAADDSEDDESEQSEVAAVQSPVMPRNATLSADAAGPTTSRAPMPPVKRARISSISTGAAAAAATAAVDWDTSRQRYSEQPPPPPPAPAPSLYMSAGEAAEAEAAAARVASSTQWQGSYWAPGSLVPTASTSAVQGHSHGVPVQEGWRAAALASPSNPHPTVNAWLPHQQQPQQQQQQAFSAQGSNMYASTTPDSPVVVPFWAGHEAGTSRMAQALPSGVVRGQMQHAAYAAVEAESRSRQGSSTSMAPNRSSTGGSTSGRAAAAPTNGLNAPRNPFTNGSNSTSSRSAAAVATLPPHISPSATFSTGPTGPDAYPFAAPPPDHSAEYGWLMDGHDPFAELESNEADSRRTSATQSQLQQGNAFGADPSPAMLVETAARRKEEERYEAQARGMPVGAVEGEEGGSLRKQLSPAGLLAEAATLMVQAANEASPFTVIEDDASTAKTPAENEETAKETRESERDAIQCEGIDKNIVPAQKDDVAAAELTESQRENATLDALLQFGTSDAKNDGGEEAEQQQEQERVEEEPKNWFRELEATLPREDSTFVTENTRQRLLRFLSTIPELPEAPLFTPRAISCYLFLFFSKYNYIYPLIHRPSFVARDADAMLLSAMIVIGAHFADLQNHVLGVRIGSKLWGAYFSLDDFLPARATLSMLQAMLLTEAFGKLMATRPQHETCHLMHGAVVTLARRNACFHASTGAPLPGEEGSHEQWLAWVREEEKKRIALFCFVLDAQHATLFRHTPALSAFQIQLQLPCDEEEWLQTNAADWHAVRSATKRQPPFFIAALKACMTSGSKSPPVGDTFSRFILFHGLLSVAYDLQWKRHTLIDPIRASDWREKLSASFAAWKTRLDAACAQRTASLTAQAIFKASSSLVVWSQIVLVTDTVDIQIYAGLPAVLGRFIDRSTFVTARKNVKEWAARPDGRVAVWYAAHFLRATLLGNGSVTFVTKQHGLNPALEHLEREVGAKRGNDVALYELVHHQWIMYLCALVVWAYGQALEPAVRAPLDLAGSNGGHSNTNGKPRSHSNASSSYATLSTSAQHARASAVAYLDAMATSAPEDIADVRHAAYSRTRGVLQLVEQSLRASSARWELLDEGADVLAKLIRADEGGAAEGGKAGEEG